MTQKKRPAIVAPAGNAELTRRSYAGDCARVRQDAQGARYAVETKKHSGRWIVFQRYANRDDADNAVRLLAWAGAIARVVQSRARREAIP